MRNSNKANTATFSDTKLWTSEKRENYYKTHKGFLLHIIRRHHAHNYICGIDEDDIFQELSIKLFSLFDIYDCNNEAGSSFETFAFHVLNNEVLGLYRSMNSDRRRMALEDIVSISEENGDNFSIPSTHGSLRSGTEDLMMESDFMENAAHIIRNSPNKNHWKIFSLTYIYGLSQKEISERLGLSQPSISRNLDRIYELIRQEFCRS